MQAVRRRIETAALAASRPVDDVGLLAVSKTWSAERVREAALAGQRAFGENYVQEGVDKIAALRDLTLEWHFIGPLQSNKSRLVAENFDWIHSVDRLKLAQRLSQQRPDSLPPLNLCIQVNVSGEQTKSGIDPSQTVGLAAAIAELPKLRLRGLMCIPEPDGGKTVLRSRFEQLRVLCDNLNAAGLMLDTLSMGMSDDLELAIAEGATIVRVGSAIFGQRDKHEG